MDFTKLRSRLQKRASCKGEAEKKQEVVKKITSKRTALALNRVLIRTDTCVKHN